MAMQGRETVGSLDEATLEALQNGVAGVLAEQSGSAGGGGGKGPGTPSIQTANH